MSLPNNLDAEFSPAAKELILKLKGEIRRIETAVAGVAVSETYIPSLMADLSDNLLGYKENGTICYFRDSLLSQLPITRQLLLNKVRGEDQGGGAAGG